MAGERLISGWRNKGACNFLPAFCGPPIQARCHSGYGNGSRSSLWRWADSLVAGGVDGDHVLQTEVPLQVRVQEGHHKAARGAVHVDLDIPSILLIQLACKRLSPRSVLASRCEGRSLQRKAQYLASAGIHPCAERRQ